MYLPSRKLRQILPFKLFISKKDKNSKKQQYLTLRHHKVSAIDQNINGGIKVEVNMIYVVRSKIIRIIKEG